MRIKYDPIEERPKCPICNNPVRWYGHKANRLFFKTCCNDHEIILRKMHIKDAVKEKYGVDNVFQLDSVKQQIKETMIQKYGVDNPQKSDIIKEKSKNTCLRKYGVTNGGGTKESIKKIKFAIIKKFGNLQNFYKYSYEKSKETCLRKYGAIKYNNMPKNIETCMSKYGVPYYLQSKERYERNAEFQAKITKTKKQNKTWTGSKSEAIIYSCILRKYFTKNDIICQYRNDKEYPFNCDFYIKSLNLYIEFQGYWTHGRHPYNDNSIYDQKMLNDWKLKANGNQKSSYYGAIHTWTISDPYKRLIANQNQLNFIEFWNIIEVKEYFEKYYAEN